jgi:hypothetical protein
MSEVVEVIVQEELYELSVEDGIELVLIDDQYVLSIDDSYELLVEDEVIELLLDSEPGLPQGGSTGQVLAKRSDMHFDAEWVTIATKITVGPTAPPGPNIGDLWVDTN